MKTNIHDYLSKSKNRAKVLFPPGIICIAGMITAFVHSYTGFSFRIIPFFQYAFIIGAVWMLLVTWLVCWSDGKRDI